MDLKNKEKILNLVENYCLNNKLDLLEIMNNICDVIENKKEKSKHLDFILDELLKEINSSIYVVEKELYMVLSLEIEKKIREDLFNQIEKEEYEDIMSFLKENYKKVFKKFYKKRGKIDERDFYECSLSISKSYKIDKEIAEVFVSVFIENEILKIKI